MDKEIRRQEITEFARKLRELIEIAPDGYARKDLNRALHFLRQRYAVSAEKKRTMILQIIADGATSFDEIYIETGFTRHQVERGIKALLDLKIIRSSKHSTTGRGRPSLRYFILNLEFLHP